MRVVIYIRVSDESQVDGYSLDAQERICRDFATIRGWIVVAVYCEEGVSGRNADRPAFLQMQSDFKRLAIEGVLVYDLDRVMRNLELQLRFKRDLDRQRVALASVMDGGLIDTDSPEGIAQFQMKGMFNEWYSNQLSRKTKMGLLEKAMQGEWIGPVPQGYERECEGGELRFSADKGAIELLGDLYASGQHSLLTVADTLNAAGWRALDWRTGNRRLFGRETIRSMLKNKAYIGIVTCNNREFPGQHPPIWSQDTWDRIQRVLRERTHTTRNPKHQTSPAWLTGMVFCDRCGGRLWHQHSGVANATRPYDRYYRCSGVSRRECDAPMISAPKIEAHMLAVLQLLVVSSDIRAQIIAQIQTTRPAPVAKPNTDLDKKLARLNAAYAEEILTKAEYEAKRNALLATVEEPQPLPVRSYSAEQIHTLLDLLPDVLTHAQPERLRALVYGLVEKIEVYRHNITAITPRYDVWPLFAAISCLERVADGRQYLTPNNQQPIILRAA